MGYAEWLLPAVRVLVGAGMGLLAGFLVGRPWLGVALALGLQLLWQFARLARVVRWLRADMPEPAPEFGGLWGDAVALVVRLKRRKQYHKTRLLKLLRELRRSTTAMPDGVVVLNPNAEILWFNRTAGRLLGLRGKSDVGRRIDNLVRHPDFVRYLRGGQYAAPAVIRPTATVEQYLSLQVVPYGAGQLLILVSDVTRQALLEAMRKEFVANASHELRSPLTVVSGYLETLAQDPSLPPDLAAPLQEMRRQALRMNLIVRDLLELSGLEASDAEIEGAPIDLAVLLAQLRQDVAARPQPHPNLTLAIESDARLLGDENQIHSAFRNLVDNAVKYTPADGSITVRWWTDVNGGHLSVTDTGMGIAAEHLPRLTERFYRVDPGRGRATGGSGLGLAIVKHVLQRHGAQLQIQSQEGHGSVFTCNFPPRRLLTQRAADAVVAAGAGTTAAAHRPSQL
jgi:two-component system phosphate regulon sensor histidine kinase PhoR